MNRREPRQYMDDAIFCWYFCWYLFPSAGNEKSRYQQEVSMPLTDSKGKALYGRARKGEKVDKEADGGGLNLQGGKIPGLSCRFAGKRKTLPLGVSPDVSLKAGRPEAMPGRLSPKAQTRRTEKGAQRGRAAPRHGIRRDFYRNTPGARPHLALPLYGKENSRSATFSRAKDAAE